MTLLYGAMVTLRPVAVEDADRLAGILAEPEIAQWRSRQHGDARCQFDELLVKGGLAIEFNAELIGCARTDEEPARDYRHAGIEVALDPAWHGKGLGADTVRTLARYLVYDRGHHRLVVDLAVDNHKAIRTFQRVGFKQVGVMREYERAAQGEWRDVLLLDLLKPDLQ